MQKALIAGIDEKVLKDVYDSVRWGNAGYDAADIAKGEKEAVRLIREQDYDVLILQGEDFPWEKVYRSAGNISGRVDLILLCQSEDYALAKEALNAGASGLFTYKEVKEMYKSLESIYNRRRSSSVIAGFLSDEHITDSIFFQLNGNNVTYFEGLFQELENSKEDKEIIRAVCVKLMGIIYDYLEKQGFKNASLQRSSAIRKISEMGHISEAIRYTKDRYINIFQFETEKNQDYYYALTESIKEYILNNYTGEVLGVPKIAERFHFSANYVNGIFKSQTGETIPSYITNLRLGKAKKLLTETKTPVSEIAIEVGYSRLTYFSRIFKKKYNISPNEYRNKFSKEI